MIDIGCGTARWSDYFLDKAGFIEAIDPSDAIFAANKLLQDGANVRITKASVDTIPWPDETFDFGMSVGVLHHIPDTKQALVDCVKKIKKGGYFYVYLYYKLDGRSFLFKALFQVSDLIRKLVSRMPPRLKRITCDIIAVTVYMPFALVAKFFYAIGLPKIALKIPLSTYAKRDFYNIRNDALDRFGTKLEQRFTKEEIEAMMTEAGLVNIKFGEKSPFWHCVGQKKL
jgi:SAM-dependent methyltransferase